MSQTNYPGKGKMGFGGTFGMGSISVSNNGTTVTFVFNRGMDNFTNSLVIYIDSKAGGFSNTSGFTDQGDDLRKSISGLGGTNMSALTFPEGFTPDCAIAFDKGFGGIWALQNGPTEHTYITSANLAPGTITETSATYTVTASKVNLGITGGITFKFLGTYISNTGYRSNEAVGDMMTGFTEGWVNQTITTFNTYSSPPLPVKLVGFKAIKESGVVKLNWTVAKETNIENYQVQRSKNGINFTTIQIIQARNQSACQPNYILTDASPLKGINYYRLAVLENGRKELSGVATVTMSQAGNNFTINYTPGSTKLNIRLIGLDAGNYLVSMVNAGGQVLQSMRLTHDGAEVNREVTFKGGLSKGIYRVVLLNNDNRSSQAFMVP